MSEFLPQDRDDRLRAAAARAYRGPHAFADAERWTENPAAPGHDGAPSPFADLERARRAVYASDGDRDLAARYRALQRAVNDNHDAVEAAFAAAALSAAAPAGELARGDAVAPVEAAAPAARRRRHPLSILAPLLAALVAFAVGIAVAPVLGRASGSSPAAAPSPTYAPFTVAAGKRVTGLTIFSTAQDVADRPSFTPGATLLPASFRLLQEVGQTGVRLYAAQTDTRDVCLVALAPDERLGASCASASDFRRAPLTLDITAAQDPVDLRGGGSRVEILSFWSYSQGSGWTILTR